MKRKKHERRTSVKPAKRKISEMILEFAGDFIALARTRDQRQSHVNAACSAWNIACQPAAQRQAMLDQYMAGYLRFNPHTDPRGSAAVRSDMEKLIASKLRMFPADLRQILDVRVTPVGDTFRVDAVSVTVR